MPERSHNQGNAFDDQKACPDSSEFTGHFLEQEGGLGIYHAVARMYDPESGRFWGVDAMRVKYPDYNSYNYTMNNPLKFIDPDGRDAILIVWPDYPAGGKDGTGHAGVLLINNKTGLTKYYEYGRYDRENQGIVIHYAIPNVEIGEDGKPTEESLNNVLDFIGVRSGTREGKTYDLIAAYFESDKFEEMNSYAQERLSENSNPDRKSYSTTTNNCGHFATNVIRQDSNISRPLIRRPAPKGLIRQYIKRADNVIKRSFKK